MAAAVLWPWPLPSGPYLPELCSRTPSVPASLRGSTGFWGKVPLASLPYFCPAFLIPYGARERETWAVSK